MKVRKQWIGSKKPAMLGNLAELQEDIHVDLSQLTEKVARIERKMATKKDLERFATKADLEKYATKDMLQTVLDIVKQIDQRTKGWEYIPAEVTDLKNRVFKLELHAKH